MRVWYGALLAGTLPFFLAGFLVSAVANRLTFLGWGLLWAVLHTVVLRHGWQAGWPARRLAGAALGTAALGTATFGVLAGHFAEPLKLGLLAQSAFDPLVIEPRTYFIVAGALLLVAAGLVYWTRLAFGSRSAR